MCLVTSLGQGGCQCLTSYVLKPMFGGGKEGEGKKGNKRNRKRKAVENGLQIVE